MAQTIACPMPKWLRKHLKAGVLSYKEAQMLWMHALVQGQSLKDACPPSLIPVWDKVRLMQMVK